MQDAQIFELGPETSKVVHLRAHGVSVLLDVNGGLLPAITHWGQDLGELTETDASLLG